MQALHLLLERKGIGIMNEKSKSDSYAAAGVDITAGYKAVELMKKHIARTMVGGKSADIGGFGGLFELDITDMPNPVLVSGTDGVGTKLKVAQMAGKHDTVGIDLVAMCANDILATGAAGPEEIDAAMKYGPGFRYAVLGPFETADLGGVDIFQAVSDYLFPDLNNDQRSQALHDLVDQGRLGVKAGDGFYSYAPGQGEGARQRRDELFQQLWDLLKDQ